MRAMVSWLCALLMAAAAHAQTQPEPIYEPEYGQPGKDVVWVPTPQVVVETMIELARVSGDDYVIDLGSGDGRLVIAAAKRGARALGIEYDENLVRYSQRSAARQGVAETAQFLKADIFATDFSQATVLTLFLLPEMNLRLRPQFLAMKPGARIVANFFGIGDWSSDEAVHIPQSEKCETYCIAYLWIVPAKVDGTWTTRQGELALVQGHQYFKGYLFANGVTKEVVQGRVRGEALNFTIEGASYSGRVNGDVIEGTVTNAGTFVPWSARRKAQ